MHKLCHLDRWWDLKPNGYNSLNNGILSDNEHELSNPMGTSPSPHSFQKHRSSTYQERQLRTEWYHHVDACGIDGLLQSEILSGDPCNIFDEDIAITVVRSYSTSRPTIQR